MVASQRLGNGGGRRLAGTCILVEVVGAYGLVGGRRLLCRGDCTRLADARNGLEQGFSPLKLQIAHPNGSTKQSTLLSPTLAMKTWSPTVSATTAQLPSRHPFLRAITCTSASVFANALTRAFRTNDELIWAVRVGRQGKPIATRRPIPCFCQVGTLRAA